MNLNSNGYSSSNKHFLTLVSIPWTASSVLIEVGLMVRIVLYPLVMVKGTLIMSKNSPADEIPNLQI